MSKYKFVITAVVICSILGMTPVALGKSTSGPYFSFESHNYPGQYIRHANALGEISPITTTLDRSDSTFALRAGLAYSRYASFESLNYPGSFLRHQNSRLKLSAESSDDLFKKDATFKIVPGLADTNAVSFQSYNYPNEYIRHSSGHLYIAKNDNSELFREDATFRILAPKAAV